MMSYAVGILYEYMYTHLLIQTCEEGILHGTPQRTQFNYACGSGSVCSVYCSVCYNACCSASYSVISHVFNTSATTLTPLQQQVYVYICINRECLNREYVYVLIENMCIYVLIEMY